MRTITTHRVNECNEALRIEVVDNPGSGGANHRYEIIGFDTEHNPSSVAGQWGKTSFGRTIIMFQNGPIKEAGVNGITNEALLAIVEDRLACFQSGPFKCEENEEALTAVRSAMAALKSRTEKRVARGVEGTNVV